MKVTYSILFFAVFGLIVSCKSNKDVVMEKSEMKSISFGSGGGFAGAFTQYKLYESGLIEKQESAKAPFLTVNTVEKDVCEQLFNSVKSLDLITKKINDPGNMYYFLKVHDGQSMVDFQWGGVNEKVDPVIKNYYNLLTSLAKRKVMATE